MALWSSMSKKAKTWQPRSLVCFVLFYSPDAMYYDTLCE